MTRFIDLVFTAMFFLIALGCAVVYLATGIERIDLFVYGVFSFILSIMMLRSYINHIQEA